MGFFDGAGVGLLGALGGAVGSFAGGRYLVLGEMV